MASSVHITVFCLTFIIMTMMTFSGNSDDLFSQNDDWFFFNYNSGSNCMACTVLVSLVQQMALVHGTDIGTAFDTLCNKAGTDPDDIILNACMALEDTLAPSIIMATVYRYTADQMCSNLCSGYEQCTLHKNERRRLGGDDGMPTIKSLCEIEKVGPLCELIWGTSSTTRNPLFDHDGDGYAQLSRDKSRDMWRGTDCDDLNNNIYPGRKQHSVLNNYEDYNCNGISGIKNIISGTSNKHGYCSNSLQIGVVAVGDAVTANFHIPQEWLDPKMEMTKSPFKNDMFSALLNHFDWPHYSSITGTGSTKVESNEVDEFRSLYQLMVDHNRCNKNDYQNIAVNNIRSNQTFAPGIKRDKENDHPVILHYQLFASDICSPYGGGTVDRMTTPEVFERDTLKFLANLDQSLPKGSHMFIAGFVNGRTIYDVMSKQTHPLGVPYVDVYDYLNCLDISPCSGWLNNDASIREATSNRAAELEAVIVKVMQNNKYENFDMVYDSNYYNNIMGEAEQRGIPREDLISSVDGFHPSPKWNTLAAQYTFNRIVQDKSEWLGEKNEHNDELIEKFH